MFSSDQYDLLDAGDGRKLERFGPYILDRPAPAAEGLRRRHPQRWKEAHASFVRKSAAEGSWSQRQKMPQRWTIGQGDLVFELKCGTSGAVGVFPEQATNWDWLARQIGRAKGRLKILNLFAYTGGSTLAAAAAGAEVVHVDAARGVVQWARRNAKLAHLGDAPIRWIVEDARKFAERELRRGTQYDGVILDPPTYGHGPKNQPWIVADHLPGLLKTIGELTARRRAFLLLTCHAPGFGPPEVEALLAEHIFGHCQSGMQARRLVLRGEHEVRLSSGVVARWPGHEA